MIFIAALTKKSKSAPPAPPALEPTGAANFERQLQCLAKTFASPFGDRPANGPRLSLSLLAATRGQAAHKAISTMRYALGFTTERGRQHK